MLKQKPFSERIKELREARSLSQNELADKAKIAPSMLSRILTGARELQMAHLVSLAQVLEVGVTDLISDTDAIEVLTDWIPVADFESVDAERVRAQTEAELLRTQLHACEIQVSQSHKQYEGLRNENHQNREQLERSVHQLNGQVFDLKSERETLRNQVKDLERKFTDAKRHAEEQRTMVQRTSRALDDVMKQLAKQKKDTALVVAISTGLGVVGTLLVKSLEKENPPKK